MEASAIPLGQESTFGLLDHSMFEMTSQIAKIQVDRIQQAPEDFSNWESFLIKTRGDYEATMVISAEKAVFYEIARNMKGKNEISEGDIAVYVAEYCNILFGFFISAFNRRNKLKARFGIPEFIEGKYMQNQNQGRNGISLFYQCVHGKIHIYGIGFPDCSSTGGINVS